MESMIIDSTEQLAPVVWGLIAMFGASVSAIAVMMLKPDRASVSFSSGIELVRRPVLQSSKG
jgi:hypothetical protein